MVGTLFWLGAQAAEQKPSLIGATRSEVLARFGEPKSQIVVGNRQVLFFTGEKVVLRNDRVVEVEEIPVEAPSPTPAVPAETDESPKTVDTASASESTRPAVHTPVRDSSAQESGGDRDASAVQTQPVRSAPEVQIKSVRPPSRTTVRIAAAPAQAPASTPLNASSPPAARPVVTPSNAPVPQVAPAVQASPTPAANPSSEEAASAVQEAAPAAPTPTAPAKRQATRHTNPPPDDFPVDSVFTTQTYVIALVVIGGGIGYLVWRGRQRRLELAATAVSNSPFTPASVGGAAYARFSQDLLGKLEWRRFEELVAAYYNKTGVVAARTKSGPGGPVDIRISWKGEQRPFACVKCLSHTTGLVEVRPVKELSDALEAEGIRRGYVVTTGKFGIPARDLAEEKHITLISGDLFLEKLNALPDPVRAELLKDATAGDYTTATCPRCEIAMVRSQQDRANWTCVQCGAAMPGAGNA